MNKRVTGIGGIFFKSSDPKKVREWYGKHLGIPVNEWGGMFTWRNTTENDKLCTTAWNPFKSDTKHFAPSEKEFMFNYRVENLEELIKALKEEGVEQIGKIEEYEYGKFAWIMDCDGNKVELWEPIDKPFTDK